MADGRFDIAVVGGGAAGCVVAARLAETGRSVVLLEAGPPVPDPVPSDLRDGWGMTGEHDWGFTAEPNARGETRKVRRIRMLGGTSWLTRFALRGQPGDYDEWAGLGNDGWSFEDVLPVLRRIEYDVDFGDRPWHGADGSIPVNRYRDVEPTPALRALVEAAVAAGFAPIDDHNEPGAVGVGPMPMSSIDGARVTTFDAYLDRGIRSGLAVQPDSPVADLLFSETSVTGVRLANGESIHADQVVLCAGTYGSPAILLRSGIGPADDLRSLGIAVRVDLPGVGANLSDHPTVDIDAGYAGPARSAPSLHAVATFHSRSADRRGPPDLLIWLGDPDPSDSPPQLEIAVLLLKPEARGRVRLRSADPLDPPLIRLPVAEGARDRERLVEGCARAFEIIHDPAFRRVGSLRLDPPPDSTGLLALVRDTARSIPHVVGTCSMGVAPESGAVVTPTGHVHGTNGLFVADASIMPTVPSGFTQLPTIMIAECISEWVAAGG